MFFRVFGHDTKTRLPAEVLFNVEHFAIQILANSNTTYLRTVLEGKTPGVKSLPESLSDELWFYGEIPQPHRSQVTEYLYEHERALRELADTFIQDPQNQALRDEVSQPDRLPTTPAAVQPES